MSYSTVTAVTGNTIPAADINKLMENIDLVKGGTPGTAPTQTLENKQNKITPADGYILQSDENGQAESSGVATANLVTASANLADNEIILGAGANKTIKKSGITTENTPTGSTSKITTSKYFYDNVLSFLGAWTEYTPTVTSGAGSLTSYTAKGRYTKIGKTVIALIDISITNNGTGSSNIQFTLPVTATALYGTTDSIGSGRETATTGRMLQVYKISTTLGAVIYYDNPYPAVTGGRLSLSITYEAA